MAFKVPVISLNSGNDNRDSNMLNYLDAFSYSQIILNVENFEIKEYDEEFISCEMAIHGINQQIDIPLTLSRVSPHQYKVYSSFIILLDQFNISVPKLLFIPIDNEIKIHIEFLIEYQGE